MDNIYSRNLERMFAKIWTMKRNLLLLFLIFFALTGFVLWLTLLKPEPERPVLPPAQKTQEELRAEFLAKLPIVTDDFRIAYNPQLSDVVVVEISAKNKEGFLKLKEKSTIFIKNFGLVDLCSIDIRFIPVEKTASESIADSDIFPEGCPIPDWAKES